MPYYKFSIIATETAEMADRINQLRNERVYIDANETRRTISQNKRTHTTLATVSDVYIQDEFNTVHFDTVVFAIRQSQAS